MQNTTPKTTGTAGNLPAGRRPAKRALAGEPFVYVLILNWNGWPDTIECLESVLRVNNRNLRIIVCDNDSGDNSLEHIKAWAEGRLDAVMPCDGPLRDLSFPPVAKPVAFAEYDRAQAESGGSAGDDDARLVLIQTGANLGCGGGNNVGLRYVLARGDFDYVWMLNPDTVVAPNALDEMLAEMRLRAGAGMCGSTLLFYERPDVVQELGGGMFYKWFGVNRPIGRYRRLAEPLDAARIRARLGFISGASLLVSAACLRDTGLLDEEYFIYGEGTDWCVTAMRRYALTFAPDSRVYHKKGASTGAGSRTQERNLISDYYYMRNRLLITRKFFPIALPTVYLGLILSALNRLRLGRWAAAKLVFKLVLTRGRTSWPEAGGPSRRRG